MNRGLLHKPEIQFDKSRSWYDMEHREFDPYDPTFTHDFLVKLIIQEVYLG